MELSNLYQLVLLVLLIGMIAGVGVLTLDKFATTSGVTVAAATALNNTRDAVAAIPNTWLSLVITIAVLAIIVSLVIGAFSGFGNRK
jgi:hypothetical protein